ncbi:E3 ubiquitin-protein ligase [Plectosphaerella plurivora]|uniref:HECT-type E3 ubiquitin transferase n=1 Tax=Plectosphaerella plurivora TaxID=936078 RepID=A0A9P9A9B8_9PEZI|nr:E3 ubiquitin-protein ligase [Plectosphaerella plurivora]
MGKISKTMQPKHEETQSPWLRDFVSQASSTPLPLLPKHLAGFPTRWPFPRGDLYHWIPLLNRFDDILETFSHTYKLNEGPQPRELSCDVLLNPELHPTSTAGGASWTADQLKAQGYGSDGDRQLILAVLKFSRVLLEHCGNRSIYASSTHLNDLLNTTCLATLTATLEVGTELAKRYQASVKRIGNHSRHVSTALLSNHYNIELERVQQLASPFVKTPLVTLSDSVAVGTPSSASKGKDKSHGSAHKNAAPMFANDLGAISNSDNLRWAGWADIKIAYAAPAADAPRPQQNAGPSDRPSTSTLPTTPTPLRRSTSMGTPAHQTPRSARQPPSEDNSPASVTRSPAVAHDRQVSGQKIFDLPQSVVASQSIYDLLARCPADLPASAKYEFLNRLRIAKALVGTTEERQQALAVRLLAITNLAYIHQENVFMEKVMRPDVDETRRFQLVYQLAELIRPPADGTASVPLWLQAIALALLEAISNFQARYQDVLSALNANVNHGILLYVIRKAVSEMEHDDAPDANERSTEADDWRKELFSLTQHLAMATRIGTEMVGAGLMDVLVDILKLRTNVAQRNQATILNFVDGLIWAYQNAFQAFFNGDGLDSIADLLVTSVSRTKETIAAGKGTKAEFQSSVVDYTAPFHQQQTMKWLLKFMHHMMSNSFSIGGNTDRLLRNLVDKSDLLASMREIMQHTAIFGSVLWTNSVTVLSDFINNDPTSYAAIAESRMIVGFLESVTGKPVADQSGAQRTTAEGSGADDNAQPPQNDEPVVLEPDGQPHPPSDDVLAAEEPRTLAQGILPTAEAVLVIPQVLNSISLNNAGLKMVVSSRAFDRYFEIFESPKHVNQLAGDHQIALTVGETFDELARHHPALRNAISDSVIDMAARIRYLGRQKAQSDGWGVKLVFSNATGDMVTADDDLVKHAAAPTSDSKGKAHATASDGDVEMGDDSATKRGSSDASPKSSGSQTPLQSITPYINALLLFLSSYLSNHTLKANFIQRGGIELLLDIAELPSLPHDFCGSPPAIKLSHVMSQLIDHSASFGMPSLLKRTQAAVDRLKPFFDAQDGRPWFEPFLSSDESTNVAAVQKLPAATQATISSGTQVIKDLLIADTFIQTLCECFAVTQRSSTLTLYPVNVFDYYLSLVKALGPLLGATLREKVDLWPMMPPHWWGKNVTAGIDLLALLGDTSAVNSAAAALADGVAAGEKTTSSAAEKWADAQLHRPLTKQEQATARYKNFETISTILPAITKVTIDFFQQFGKAILPRRERDLYSRQHHVELAKSVSTSFLDQLKPYATMEKLTPRDYQYLLTMVSFVPDMFLDRSPRTTDRSAQIIMPVYIAFAEQGGLGVLTSIATRLADTIQKDEASGDEASLVAKACSKGLKRLLDLFAVIVEGKAMSESAAQFGLIPRTAQRREEPTALSGQLTLDARTSVFPFVRQLWASPLMEQKYPEILNRVIGILKTISVSDCEPDQPRASALDVLKTTPTPFVWQGHQGSIASICREYDEDLAREGIYRANGHLTAASEYCRAHTAGHAGGRNPIPAEDAYPVVPAAEPSATPQTGVEGAPVSATAPEPMAVDPMPANPLEISVLDDLEHQTSDESGEDEDDEEDDDEDDDDEDDDMRDPQTGSNVPDTTTNVEPSSSDATSTVATKQHLDEQREQLRKELMERSLDIVRAHPHSAIEIADLISHLAFPREDSEIREEVGTLLTSAISSLSYSDDDDQADRDANANTIAAYAHLFALLLRENAFLECNLDNLRSNIDTYVKFLKVAVSTKKDELPAWIPFILLIIEILLSHDERPVEAKWRPPANENDEIQQAVIEKPEPILSEEQHEELLDSVMELLPRLGKGDTLAISTLRVLVILTRKRSLARKVGEKKNLQRLFVLAKQLATGGAARLKDTKAAGSIMIILRHVVEDEETVKQIMRAEIRQLFENPQRTQRSIDLITYLRSLAPIALRSPDLFVEVTNDMTKLTRWSPMSEGSARSQQLALKEVELDENKAGSEQKDESVEPTVQATEDLTIHDVKQSTETGDKEMIDAPKSAAQRPIIENPDGVVHFLLCELLNFREVDDKEVAVPTDSKPATDPVATSSASSPSEARPQSATPEIAGATPETKEAKDKKAVKPAFKAEDHPIFVYRCFLLNCLTELLGSYNRAKVEFINFKRSAPLQTNTPVKPRSSVLNYLIHDLLCQGSPAETADSVPAKKKVATSAQAQQVLVALVSRTGERPAEKNLRRFEYDDDPDLIFVRKFALDTILKAYERASSPDEPLEARYIKMQCLAELVNQIIGENERDPSHASARGLDSPRSRSQAQLRRMMYEKGYLDKLTSSIADLDLGQASVKRAIKYVLRVLRVLTDTAKELSRSNIMSSSSMSDVDDDREETPDLYRNSTLGMLEPRGSDDESDEDEDGDEEMYDDEYGDELDYGDEEITDDGDEGVSDDDDEELGEMGEIEGLHGEPGVVEVVMDDDDDEDMDEDDDDELSDDELDSDDMDDLDDHVHAVELDEEGNEIGADDDASGWESETDDDDEGDDDDEIDYDVEEEDIEDPHLRGLAPGDIIDNLARAVMDPDEDFEPEELDEMGDHYLEDGRHDDDDFRSYFSRRHRGNVPQNAADDGVNPLLRRADQESDMPAMPPPGPGQFDLRLPPDFFGPNAGRGGVFEGPMAILNDLVAHFPVMNRSGPPIHLHVHPHPRGDMRYPEGSRPAGQTSYQEPQQAVAFGSESTFERYQEEARMVFGGMHFSERAMRLGNLILSKLVPPAMERERKLKAEDDERRRVREEERKKKEEEDRLAHEAKVAKERAEQERLEAEERAERERLAAEAPSQQTTDTPAAGASSRADPQAMEGVETETSPQVAEPAADVPRVVTIIRGEEVDITELGIDPEYLAALPEEFREEVIAQTVSSRRSQAREDAAAGEQPEVFQEFLDALPEEIRSEIVQQERQETRRREREELRRQAATGQDAHTAEMDAASILMTFPPELRQQVLIEQGEDLMDHLTPDMAAQVRQRQRPDPSRAPGGQQHPAAPAGEDGEATVTKTQRKTVVQMLDKAGVATLLRLMFISQYGPIRSHLFGVLADVCENRQNRLDVISTILLILQEGSTDMDAVERSFSQLSLKAKRPKDRDADPKTPTQSLKRTLTSLTAPAQSQTNSEISPLLVVHQCLDLLQDLSARNPHVPMLFLTEHESVASSLKRSLSKKGKGKEAKDTKDPRSQKYAINSLLTLLDRDLVMDSSVVMAFLADLLNKITVPLATMERRRKDAQERAEKAAAEAAKKAADEAKAAEAVDATSSTADQQAATATPATTEAPAPAEAAEATAAKGTTDTPKESDKKSKQLQVPVIPPSNLKLVVKIFVARECSSKTFQNTISAIKNLSVIPGAKAVFGQELVHQAQVLSENIVNDLDELLPHILKATSGTEIQGVALAKFSPGASEQNKLLRVLTALDHLFDTKKKTARLYHNATFSKMWEKLSGCLSAIRQRENMVNVATILLPLIESLMVVCKNTANTESTTQTQPDKELLLSSPPPESRMAGLFFNFTEDHRRILNELVRNNPKLMSGTFALLVKNPKVLEFDNKRNYFNRSVHSRSTAQRPSFQPLQLAVRRSQVFHDSFRSLYFKSGDEMKYGKLNIRFHGEEGVDAGGVTREWFQVLARQMFDANYALFIPVSSDRTTFHPNKLSGINDMHTMYFKFVGRIIGKALYEGRVLDCYFSRAVYKRILGKSVSVKDMESFDPDYYKSLVWMLENDITDIITETFSVEDDEFGVTTIVDLCPDGRNIPVTEDNKHEYVRLVVEHKLLTSVKEQMEHFLKGFHEIIPAELISIFNEQELELLISGLPDIDVDDWKSNTEYHNYNPSSQQIQWFWRAIRSFDKEELAKLLQFVTGTSKVPLNGFKELEGMNGVNRFNIHRDYGSKERLPSSHTCFNQLDLPEYESYETLRAQVLKAITAGSDYFGFA